MEPIVIVGNGVAGATAALTARERTDAPITLLSAESPYFFSRTGLMYVLLGRMSRRDLEPFERASWSARGIERVEGTAVALDATRRELGLADGRTLRWGRLLLAGGARARRLGVQGESADAVVNLVTLGDLGACERWIPSTREAVVIGGGLIGIELVECLVHHGVKTTFVVREPWYWPAALCAEEGEMIAERMRHHGVILRSGVEASEIAADAEGRARAVTLSDGAVLPAQLVGVCVGVVPEVEWLKGVATPPRLGRGVIVDATLRTSLDDVWSAGDCAELSLADGRTKIESIWYSAKRQGELAGRNMTGASREYAPPIFFNSARLFDVDYTTVGELSDLPAGAASLYRRHPAAPMSQRIVHHEDRVLGFNMLGSRWDHEVLSRWIEERRSPSWVVPRLPHAQFDVEFGRAKLAEFDERPLDVVGRGAGGRP